MEPIICILIITAICIYLAYISTSNTSDIVQFLEAKAKYMGSPAWRAKRSLALDAAGHKCTCCGTYQNLVIHWDKYPSLPSRVPASHLRVLCRSCKADFNRKYPQPLTHAGFLTFDTTGVPHGKI